MRSVRMRVKKIIKGKVIGGEKKERKGNVGNKGINMKKKKNRKGEILFNSRENI